MVCRTSLSKCKSGLGLFDNSPNMRSVKIVLRSVKSQGIFFGLLCVATLFFLKRTEVPGTIKNFSPK